MLAIGWLEYFQWKNIEIQGSVTKYMWNRSVYIRKDSIEKTRVFKKCDLLYLLQIQFCAQSL
jgi:hypothetical protein